MFALLSLGLNPAGYSFATDRPAGLVKSLSSAGYSFAKAAKTNSAFSTKTAVEYDVPGACHNTPQHPNA
jgi:hypothetical protein